MQSYVDDHAVAAFANTQDKRGGRDKADFADFVSIEEEVFLVATTFIVADATPTHR